MLKRKTLLFAHNKDENISNYEYINQYLNFTDILKIYGQIF